ncbi:transporter [Iodobacter sp. CM08]|uniref:SphA family protein n=1 Tax=Iodobacter sp. CM08 TaxID=3085902 RepID=UPI00298123A9|nr:transporter [Iodobacter sp. CM08]MDW5416646.1 transporter [Iodobacter sp. CM08]
MKKCSVIPVATRLSLAMALSACAASALATEGGGGMYPNGNENYLVAAMPPPGVYVLEYLIGYQADKLRDNNGNQIPLDFNVKVAAAATRLIWVTDQKILDGQLALHVIAPLLNVDVSVAGKNQSQTGVGDMVFGAGLGYHASDKLHYVFAVDINAPTGRYDKNDLANLGRNYWNIEPLATVSYIQKSGLNADLKVMYDFNGKNKDSDYTSGQELHADYALGWGFGNGLVAGVGGFLYQQITDDKVGGVTLADQRGRAMSIGPTIKYDNGSGFFVTAKIEKEFGVRNRADGTGIKVKFNIPF